MLAQTAIDVTGLAVRHDAPDLRRHGVYDASEFLLALPQRFVGALAVVYVDADTITLDDRAVVVEQRLRSSLDPPIDAIRAPLAIFHLEGRSVRRRPPKLLLDGRSIVWMDDGGDNLREPTPPPDAPKSSSVRPR